MKEGDIIEVTWKDASGFINVDETEVKLAEVVNVGYLVKCDEDAIVLQAGKYTDGSGDFTVIPRGWADKITVIKAKGKKRVKKACKSK